MFFLLYFVIYALLDQKLSNAVALSFTFTKIKFFALRTDFNFLVNNLTQPTLTNIQKSLTLKKLAQ